MMTVEQEKIVKMIPIGVQRYAYQGVSMQRFKTNIIAELSAMSRGSLPYPNDEKDMVLRYELSIERFTQNAIEVCLVKFFKDKSTKTYLVNLTFEQFVNQIFGGLEVTEVYESSKNHSV